MPRVIGGSSAGSIVCAMVGTRTDEECENDLFEARGTNAPGHSGELRFNFFRPMPTAESPEEKPRTRKGGFREVYHNTAGAFHDAKRTLQGFMPIPVRHMTSFIYDILTGNRRAQDVFKNDTQHFRECVRANVGNFTFQEAFDRTGRILNIVVTPNNDSDPPRLLNYLTAPHVMVWSAAVASSSLPGVFEANRLVVKEADGWERYESGHAGQHFSDGSMEQDLPMQQLSEMFNVNHFIISQANPHAVMFASYNQKLSVWTNPLTGLVRSVLHFLKDQVRSWLLHLVECVGARRISPLFQTQRGMGTQFFTQEYEGRSMDISLIPWIRHRGLLSALLHIIYNPSEAEFREWIQASERETWRYIPAIKSHIAEEITLDRCVQRLRKRLTQESWEKHGEQENLGDRVPSFFRSPSLVNFGGMGVTDQLSVEGLHKLKLKQAAAPHPAKESRSAPDLEIPSGWGGRGLKGNRSFGNLVRITSDSSGLFIDEDQQGHLTQAAGEESTSARPDSRNGNLRSTGEDDTSKGYMKTTSMAHFYYRKNRSSTSLDQIPKTTSVPKLDQEAQSTRHARRKSKSVTDINDAMMNVDLDEPTFVPLKD